MTTKRAVVEPGERYGRLVVICETDPHIYPSGESRRKFLTQCDCGSEPKSVMINNLKNGTTSSCGCYAREVQTTHGMNETRQYRCWVDMKTRCDKPNNKFYDYYGGRGITYCDKWKTFEGFWEDMKDTYEEHLTINRRDNDKNYCKENCWWDTKNFQGHMRRKKKGTLFSVIGASNSMSIGRIDANIKWDIYNLFLGTYDTEEEVAEAYDAAALLFYGDRPNKTNVTRPEIQAKVDYYFTCKDTVLRPKGSECGTAKLSDDDVREIWELIKEGKTHQSVIAEKYGVLQANISVIKRGMGWNHITGLPIIRRVKKSKKAKE